MTLFLCLMPAFSSTMSSLYIGRILFGLAVHLVLYNPLILDYVKKESRGMGFALAIGGSILGLLVAYWMLDSIEYNPDAEDESDMGPTIRTQFLIYGLVVSIMSLAGFLLISEPKVYLTEPTDKEFDNSQ